MLITALGNRTRGIEGTSVFIDPRVLFYINSFFLQNMYTYVIYIIFGIFNIFKNIFSLIVYTVESKGFPFFNPLYSMLLKLKFLSPYVKGAINSEFRRSKIYIYNNCNNCNLLIT